MVSSLKWRSLTCAAAVVAVAGCAAPRQAMPPQSAVCVQSPEDARQVANIRRQLLTALNERRLDAVMAMFDEKAVVVGPDVAGRPPVADAIWTPARIREFMADKVVAPGYRFHLVGGQGVLAMDCHVAVFADHTKVSLASKESDVTVSMTLKKTDGVWRLWLLNLGKLP